MVYDIAEITGPNDEKRGQPHIPGRPALTRSSSSVSFAFGGSMKREFISAEIVILSSDEGGRATPLLPVAYRGHYRPHIVLQSRETRQAKIELRDGFRTSRAGCGVYTS